jgi:hypothetical protein
VASPVVPVPVATPTASPNTRALCPTWVMESVDVFCSSVHDVLDEYASPLICLLLDLLSTRYRSDVICLDNNIVN